MSVSTHSQPKKLMIYSTFRDDRSEELNIRQHRVELKMLQLGGHNFKVVDGVYRGSKEWSIVKDYKAEDVIYALDFLQQYSVLVLENHKHGLYRAFLHYPSKIDFIGFFRQVSKEIAIKEDSYTQDGDNYYIVTESDTVVVDDLIKLNLQN